jgi:hypothetical protein
LYNWISRKLIYALGRKRRNHNQQRRKWLMSTRVQKFIGPGDCNHWFWKPNALISLLRGAGKQVFSACLIGYIHCLICDSITLFHHQQTKFLLCQIMSGDIIWHNAYKMYIMSDYVTIMSLLYVLCQTIMSLLYVLCQ